jgi:integrase
MDVTIIVTTTFMASLTKKSNSKFWFACFRDRGGKQHRRSTGETNERKALEIARRYEQVAQHKLKPAKFRETLVELYREVYGTTVPKATVREFAEEWLKVKKPEVAHSSWDNYRKSIDKFLAFLRDDSELDISFIARAHITAFRNDLAQKVAPATANVDLKTIKRLFRTAKRDGYIDDDPAEFVITIRRDNARGRRPLTIPEIQATISVADPQWQSLIRFGLYTGQRLADIALLTWSNIDLERNEIRFVTRKTGKRIILPMTGALRNHVLSLPASDDPEAPLHPKAFETVKRQSRTGTLSNQFAALLADAGLRVRVDHSSKGKGRGARRSQGEISFHSLRHTAVSLLKDAGIPEAVVMEMVGHDSEQMSAHYTHVGREALEKAAAALPEV